MSNQKQTEEEKEEVKPVIEFTSIAAALEHVNTVDVEQLGNIRSTLIDNQEELNDGNAKLAIAFRKILSSANVAAKNAIKAKFQGYFDIRDDKTKSDAKRKAARSCIQVLSRAMRTATDNDAKKRELWAEDYTISVNTINNNGNARFAEKNHVVPENSDTETDKKNDRKINNFDGAFDYVLLRFEESEWKILASLISQRFEFEKAETEFIYVPVKGGKPAHFQEVVKEVAA